MHGTLWFSGPMRRGASGIGLNPNTLLAPSIPSRRSSAVELYSSSYGQSANFTGSTASTALPQPLYAGASLHGNSVGHYGNFGVSRSAATSPVGGASGNISFLIECFFLTY